MAGKTVTELVTKFTTKMDSGFGKYEKTLKALDKQGASFSKQFAKHFQQSTEAAIRHGKRSFEGLFRGVQAHSNRLKLRPQFALNGIGKAHSQLKGINSEASALSRRLKGMALSIGGGLVGAVGVGLGGKAFIEAASEYETAITRLNTLVGKQRAGGVFGNLQKFSAKTPFELPEILDMFIRLQGAGFELMNRKTGQIDYKKLVKLGDLAAASNKPLSELVDAMLSSGRGLGSMVDNFIGLGAKAEGGGLSATMADLASGKQKKFDIAEGDKKALFDFWLQAGQRSGVAGGMDALSGTLKGQFSTLSDTAKNLMAKAWLGFDEPVHKWLNNAISGLNKMEPTFIKVGQTFGKHFEKIPSILNSIGKFAPIAAFGMAVLTARFIGLKAIATGAWLVNLAMGVSAISIGAALLPIAIGAGIVAITAFGIKTYQYLTEGDKALVELRKKWPLVADSVKYVGEMIKWVTDKTIIFIENWISGYKTLEVLFNNVLQFIKGIGQGFIDWKTNVDNTFNAIKELVDWIMGKVGPVGEALAKMFGPIGQGLSGLMNALGGGGQGGGGDLGAINTSATIADRLVADSKRIYSGYKQCFNGVWQIYRKTMGGKDWFATGSAAKAYQGADSLAKDKRFKEVTVTRAMMSDPEALKKLHGGVAFFNRQAGFSKTAGHTEVWDTKEMKARYGDKPRNLRVSDQMLKNMRYFVPVEYGLGAGNKQANIARSGSPSLTVQNQIVVNAQNNPNAKQIATQTADRVGSETAKSLHSYTGKLTPQTARH